MKKGIGIYNLTNLAVSTPVGFSLFLFLSLATTVFLPMTAELLTMGCYTIAGSAVLGLIFWRLRSQARFPHATRVLLVLSCLALVLPILFPILPLLAW